MDVLDGVQHEDDVCSKADTHTVRFTFAGTTTLSIISTYIPPAGMVYASVCQKDVECVGDCPSNHPGVNINHVERQLDLRRAEGAVIVLGDCNADPTTKRFEVLEQQWGIGQGPGQLQIANAHGRRDGAMRATRKDAVLDYIFTSGLQTKSCQVDTKTYISDHYPVLAVVELDIMPRSQAQQPRPPPPGDSNGTVGTQQRRDLPISIRGAAHKEVPMLTASEWEQIRFNVADALEKRSSTGQTHTEAYWAA